MSTTAMRVTRSAKEATSGDHLFDYLIRHPMAYRVAREAYTLADREDEFDERVYQAHLRELR